MTINSQIIIDNSHTKSLILGHEKPRNIQDERAGLGVHLRVGNKRYTNLSYCFHDNLWGQGLPLYYKSYDDVSGDVIGPKVQTLIKTDKNICCYSDFDSLEKNSQKKQYFFKQLSVLDLLDLDSLEAELKKNKEKGSKIWLDESLVWGSSFLGLNQKWPSLIDVYSFSLGCKTVITVGEKASFFDKNLGLTDAILSWVNKTHYFQNIKTFHDHYQVIAKAFKNPTFKIYGRIVYSPKNSDYYLKKGVITSELNHDIFQSLLVIPFSATQEEIINFSLL